MPQKDDLVAAYVERADRLYRAWFYAATAADGRHPRERILALFDALAEQVHPAVCRGCPFLMALAEHPDLALPTHRNAVAMKAWVRSRFGELTDELARTTLVDDPAALADQLALVMEGVYGSVQALGTDGPARPTRALVELLLSTAESRTTSGAWNERDDRARVGRDGDSGPARLGSRSRSVSAACGLRVFYPASTSAASISSASRNPPRCRRSKRRAVALCARRGYPCHPRVLRRRARDWSCQSAPSI
jgi:AcrR family transcriptional regulator